MKHLALSALLGLAIITPSVAQGNDRYQIEERDGQIIRLDRETGAVSACERTAENNLVCRLAADDRDALLAEIERLETENATLRDELAARPQDATPQSEGDWSLRWPTDEEIDQGVEALGNLARRFGQEVEQLRRDWMGEPAPAEEQPQQPGNT